MHHVIGIEPCNEFTASYIGDLVQPVGQTLVRAVGKHSHSGIAHTVSHFQGSVRGPVVHEQQFPIFEGLRKN
jgi:hypothetical protein